MSDDSRVFVILENSRRIQKLDRSSEKMPHWLTSDHLLKLINTSVLASFCSLREFSKITNTLVAALADFEHWGQHG